MDSEFQVLESGIFVSRIWIPDCIVIGFLELCFSNPIPLKFSQEIKLAFVKNKIGTERRLNVSKEDKRYS